MIDRAKDNWICFKQGRPGHRFQDHHRRYQRGRIDTRTPHLRGLFGIVGGFLVVVGGLVAVPGPGPGWLIILLGLGMVAGESLLFARLLDRVEVKLRGLTRRVVGIWRTSPAFVRVWFVLAIIAGAIAAAVGFVT